ncbi:MFS transporter [Streptomyces sp. NBC_00503]|uniref:MFS transporter n=1 Tax=Streptomyces sp. NBC_00503 TaxID=2903659 RepID=UPI002E804B29|nr:MFS transporter [Streptomyces sp. NBC_00503]WUD81275.1 MFS transporter [Streptomyces sp. NBC_00503]
MSDHTPAPPAAWPLVALFTAGYTAPYLLPTVVGRLDAYLPLSPAQAGLIGSVLLLGSAAAGFALASRIPRHGPRPLARLGLLLAVLGYGTAAATTVLPLVVAGAVVGGFGSGTATAVAASGIAAQRDPHRTSSLGLLSVSATAGALYLTLPRLGGGHWLPFAAIALIATACWPATGRLGAPAAGDTAAGDRAVRGWTVRGRTVRGRVAADRGVRVRGRLPYPRAGMVLAGALMLWSLAQNALWGVSGRIGAQQAGLSEVTLGIVFAAALGAGLLGVTAASALGARLGRAVPVGAGTAAIAGCVVLASHAHGLGTFAAGEVLWNAFYPVVLSYAIGLAAALDPRGRWAVLVGSASSLGVACGPVAGSLLAEGFGFPGMGLALGGLLLVVAGPMAAVALHVGGRPLTPGSVRRRGGVAAAVLAAGAGTPAGSVPRVGAPELEVVELAGLPARPLRLAPLRVLLLAPTAARRTRELARRRAGAGSR